MPPPPRPLPQPSENRRYWTREVFREAAERDAAAAAIPPDKVRAILLQNCADLVDRIKPVPLNKRRTHYLHFERSGK